MEHTITVTCPENLPALIAALAKAQGEFLPIEKNRTGQDGNRKFPYADLEEIIKKTRPALASNGLAVLQPAQAMDKGHVLTTILAHKDGCTIQSTIRIPEMGEVKRFGGGITYLRRYTYQAAICVSADDDLDNDGEGGGVSDSNETLPAGKANVQMPQRRTQRQEPMRDQQDCSTDTDQTESQPENSAPCTPGERAWLDKRIEAFGMDWQQAYDKAGLGKVNGKPVTKAQFVALKAVL